jgi:hypothetical protein
MSSVMDSPIADLPTVLTKKQIADMLEFHNKMEEMHLQIKPESKGAGR